MPTPLQLLLDPTSLVLFALFASLMLWEALAPARPLPEAPLWRLRALSSFGLYFLLSAYLPLLWGEWLAAYRLFDLTALGTWAGAAVGLLVYEAGAYAWHRSMHRFDGLFRSLHQMHHSAERLDVAGAFWYSPLDMLGWIALSSLSLTVVVGLTPEATLLAVMTTSLLAMFQHTNVRTPQWLGYFVQRPEAHSRHHARGVHAGNYADLPVFDLLFGTFDNPKEFAPEQGYYPGASLRVPEMLLARDVSTPR